LGKEEGFEINFLRIVKSKIEQFQGNPGCLRIAFAAPLAQFPA